MKQRHSESGNVLFLILIAVVLFAALSYAVTSSTRGGGGNVNEEKLKTEIASFMQYITAIRTQAILMRSRGIDRPHYSDFQQSYEDGIGERCFDTPEECIFKNISYYQNQGDFGNFGDTGLTEAFDIGFIKDTGGGFSGGMTGRHYERNGRYYNYIVFRQISLDGCTAVNQELGIQQIESITFEDNRDMDLDGLLLNELQAPVRCITNTADGDYHLLAQVYESESV